MRKIFVVPVLLVSVLAFAACAGGSAETDPGASPPATAAPSTSNGDAPVIAHSKELTTIYFVHAEW